MFYKKQTNRELTFSTFVPEKAKNQILDLYEFVPKLIFCLLVTE